MIDICFPPKLFYVFVYKDSLMCLLHKKKEVILLNIKLFINYPLFSCIKYKILLVFYYYKVLSNTSTYYILW